MMLKAKGNSSYHDLFFYFLILVKSAVLPKRNPYSHHNFKSCTQQSAAITIFPLDLKKNFNSSIYNDCDHQRFIKSI